MTAVLDRPIPAVEGAPTSRLQLWARGALASVSTVAVAAAVLLVLVLVAWAADPRSSASAAEAARLGLALLPLSCRIPLHVSGGSVAIPPLGLTLLVAGTLYRAAGTLTGWWSGLDLADGRDRPHRGGAASVGPTADLRSVGDVVLAVSVPFALLVTVLSLAIGSEHLSPSVAVAPFAAFGLAAVASGAAALRRGRCWPRLVEPLPAAVTEGLRGGGLATAALVAGAGLLVVASLALHAGRLVTLDHPAGAGIVGGIVLGLASLLLLPNAVLAGLGYLTGAGFAVGGGSNVGMGSVHLGTVPGLPLLAAVPHAAAPLGVRAFLVVLVAGVGVLAAAWPRGGSGGMLEALTRAAVACATAAMLAGIAVAYAGGPAGPRGLATVGASGWRTGLLLLVELVAVAVATAVGRACWSAWSASRP